MSELELRLKLVKEIFDLSMKINQKTKYYCFFNHSPHVANISVKITPKDDYKEWLYSRDIYYDANFQTHESMIKDFNEAAKKLKFYLGESNA